MYTGKDKEAIFEKAKKIIVEENVLFIEHLISLLCISKFSFYNWYKRDSDEYNELKELIDNNVIKRKAKIYDNWADSDNPTKQISFIKVHGTAKEFSRLVNIDRTQDDEVKQKSKIEFFDEDDE